MLLGAGLLRRRAFTAALSLVYRRFSANHLFDQRFGIPNAFLHADGNQFLADEPAFVYRFIGGDDDAVRLADIFIGELIFHADRALGLDLHGYA
ncbi:hypothetical protein HMSSN139_24520 [Paenibacillus sp. HMSSN-139]|nr:hypothetical protein HMSSN139_24520 [Paenibacillus sp. HMSSN-139]